MRATTARAVQWLLLGRSIAAEGRNDSVRTVPLCGSTRGKRARWPSGAYSAVFPHMDAVTAAKQSASRGVWPEIS